MNPTKRALLDAVLANPKDTVAKLVYADWLEENESDDPASLAVAKTFRLIAEGELVFDVWGEVVIECNSPVFGCFDTSRRSDGCFPTQWERHEPD